MSAFQLAEAYVQFSQRGYSGLSGMIGGIGNKIKSLLSPTRLLASALAAVGTGVGIGSMLKLAADVETLETSFRVLLGSADAAKQMIEEINEFAAATPFEQQELGAIAKKLLAFGSAQEEVIPTMRQLGDIAALSGARMDELVNIYGKVQGAGRMMTESLNQFVERGIPIGKELARMFNVSEAAIRDMASAGKLSFGDLQQALANLTSEGGLYANGMQQLSGALGGLWSTFTGNAKTLFGKLGGYIVEAFDLKTVVANMGAFVGSFTANYGDKIKAVFFEIRNFAQEIWQRVSGVLLMAFETIGANTNNLSDVLSGHKAVILAVIDALVSFGSFMLMLVDPLLQISGAIGRWIRDNADLFSTIAKVVGVILGAVVAAYALITVVGGIAAALTALLSPIGLVAVAIGGLVLLFPEFFEGVLADLADLIRDWDLYWRIAWEETKLFLSNSWEQFKTFFVNIWELAVWFYGNWREIFVTLGNFTTTLFANLTNNLRSLWDSLLNWIAGRPFELNMTPLLDGFKSTIKEMPQLTQAKVQETNERIEALYDQLGRRIVDRQTVADKKETATAGAAVAMAGSGPGAPSTPGVGAAERKYEFVGFAQLAEKMQQEASKANEAAAQLAVAERNAKAAENLASTVEAGRLRVKMDDSGMAPNPVPSWG